MNGCRFSSLALIYTALIFYGLCRKVELDSRSSHHFTQEHSADEKILFNTLQGVLERLKNNRIPLFEMKYGQLPMCEAGERCAVRKGARIGRLCDCPYRVSCNSFLLRCL